MNSPLNTDQIIRLRASALPLAFHCPASIRASSVNINETNAAAGAGSALHELAEGLVTTGSIDWERVNEVSDKWGADDDEVRMLCGKASKMWRNLHQYYPRALTEIGVGKSLTVGGLQISGHIDLISISGDVARIGDWKSGRLDSAYWQQLRAYGSMVLLEFPQLREATVAAIWLRSEEVENYTLTQQDAADWLRDLERTVINWDGVYRPETKMCSHCPRNHDCPAANALFKRDVAAVADIDVGSIETSLAKMPAGQIIELSRRAKAVEATAKRVRDAIKARVLAGQVVEADGVALTIEREGRRELDPQKTWDVLGKHFSFGDEDYASCIKFGVSKIEKRVKELAGKGNGAAAARDLRDKLELAGAVEVNEIEKLVERRV